jgi:hypothetical protein
MGKVKSSADKPQAAAIPDGKLATEQWLALSRAYIEAHGGAAFVIRNAEPKSPGRPTPAEWLAWMAWFDRRGIATAFVRQFGVQTTPSQWPHEFDPSEPLADPLWEFPRKAVIGQQDRTRVGAMFAELQRKLDTPLGARPTAPVVATPLSPQAALDALAESYRASPATLSPEALAGFEREIFHEARS